MPIEHQALHEIVQGFKEQIALEVNEEVEIVVKNGQGDLAMQQAILSKFIRDKVDVIAPIGTTLTQMTMQLAPNEQKIVFLAANIDQHQSLHTTGVCDDIDPSIQLQTIRKVYPDLKHLTIVYSTDEKVFEQVNVIHQMCAGHDIKLHKLMVNSQAELCMMGSHLPKETQALFILKDNLVASGIQVLVHCAKEKGVPLITSDEGTVLAGASFACGVKEKDIGIEGGKLAVQVLKGQSTEPICRMEQMNIFTNPLALSQRELIVMQEIQNVSN